MKVVSSCPQCGAPIYENGEQSTNGVPNIIYTCGCRLSFAPAPTTPTIRYEYHYHYHYPADRYYQPWYVTRPWWQPYEGMWSAVGNNFETVSGASGANLTDAAYAEGITFTGSPTSGCGILEPVCEETDRPVGGGGYLGAGWQAGFVNHSGDNPNPYWGA